MKIRLGFVTNSSSASFIIRANEKLMTREGIFKIFGVLFKKYDFTFDTPGLELRLNSWLLQDCHSNSEAKAGAPWHDDKLDRYMARAYIDRNDNNSYYDVMRLSRKIGIETTIEVEGEKVKIEIDD